MHPPVLLLSLLYLSSAVTRADISLTSLPHNYTTDVIHPSPTHKLAKRANYRKEDLLSAFSTSLRLPDCDIRSVSLPDWLHVSGLPEYYYTDPPPFTTLDDNNGLPRFFKKCRMLGHGSYGTVYSAMNVITREVVAIKVFNARHLSKQAINLEVANSNHLHQLIGRYVENYGLRRREAMVIPYVRGIPLEDFYPTFNGLMLKVTLRRLAKHVIAKLFRQGFAHMDLHFGNIMVSKMDPGGLFPSGDDDAMTPIDFGLGYRVDINEDISQNVFEVIHRVLHYIFRRKKNSWEKWDDLLYGANRSGELALMMYREIKQGCPQCIMPETTTVPQIILGLKRGIILPTRGR